MCEACEIFRLFPKGLRERICGKISKSLRPKIVSVAHASSATDHGDSGVGDNTEGVLWGLGGCSF